VTGLGDEAQQYAVRAWHRPAMTFVLGLARTGQVTTVTVTRTAGSRTPDLAGNLRLLVAAVDELCVTPGGGPCSATPKATPMAPPAAGPMPMMLSEYDLPPVTGVQRPWMGTTPRRALLNVAATTCDDSSFHGHGWTHDATRSFLVPGAHLATAFGLTETVGRLPADRARSFVDGVRAELASCSDRELGTKVERLAGGQDLSAWRVRTQVSDKKTVTFFIVNRHGTETLDLDASLLEFGALRVIDDQVVAHADLNITNTADKPDNVVAKAVTGTSFADGKLSARIAPLSYRMIRLQA